MAALPSRTSKLEMREQVAGAGTDSNNRVSSYNTWLADSFADRDRITALSDLEEGGIILPMETHNDDCYRNSKHFIRSRIDLSNPIDVAYASEFEENLRENSLARQLSERSDRVATIRLIRRRDPAEKSKPGNGEADVPWVNLIPPNTKFFLQSVQENRQEKVQIIDTFGEWVAFFFGRRPEVYAYSGTLLNSKNHNWKNEFQENYDYFLRGSQAVKHRATMMMQYDDVMVEGYMIDCSIAQNAAADKAVPFSFNLLVINRSPMNPRNILGLRYQRSGGTALEQALLGSMNDLYALTKSNKPEDVETFLLMREYFSGNYWPSAGVAQTSGGVIGNGEGVSPGQASGITSLTAVNAVFEQNDAAMEALRPGDERRWVENLDL